MPANEKAFYCVRRDDPSWGVSNISFDEENGGKVITMCLYKNPLNCIVGNEQFWSDIDNKSKGSFFDEYMMTDFYIDGGCHH